MLTFQFVIFWVVPNYARRKNSDAIFSNSISIWLFMKSIYIWNWRPNKDLIQIWFIHEYNFEVLSWASKIRPHFQRAEREHGCSNHAFAVYHYLLDFATATSATTSRRMYSLTVMFNSAARLTIISWSLSETFMCMCLVFTLYLSTRYDASGRAVNI